MNLELLQKKNDQLNPQQREAAHAIYGPVLVLAGAGSGKTSTMTVRIANMLASGIQPENIFCATFTRKASKEMTERLQAMVGEEPMKKIWMGTFHSMCVKLLRKHGHLLGYDQDSKGRCSFAVYDTYDCLEVIKRIYKQMNLEGKVKDGLALHYMDHCKNNLWDPEYASYNYADTETNQTMSIVYGRYQHALKEQNAMDFGDLIMNVVILLRDYDEAREYWQQKFHYVLTDEYQDVNYAQFQLLLLLAAPHYNLFAVGDDRQSIYAFRGSNISIILSFQKTFPTAKVVMLEDNYRSVQTVVEAGNGIIQYNLNQSKNSLRSNKEEGKLIDVVHVENEFMEAAYMASVIKTKVLQGEATYKDFAILYRSNAQSRVIEDLFRSQFIPTKVVGGLSFYQREEIRDIMAYLRVVFNPKDDVAVLRVVNKPTRGIGKTSQDAIERYADEKNVSIFRSLKNASDIPTLNKRAQSKIEGFIGTIDHFKEKAKTFTTARTLVRYVLDQSGLIRHYEADKKAEEKIENLMEFLNLIDQFEEEFPDKTLAEFLQEIALVTDVEDQNLVDAVQLMTMHGSKGLEFPYVYLIGWSEGLFPSWRSTKPDELEEERRIAYVGITRAEKELCITHAQTRKQMDGKNKAHKPSRFLEEIPSELINIKMLTLVNA